MEAPSGSRAKPGPLSPDFLLGGRVLTAVVKHELLLFFQVNLTGGTLKLFAQAGFGL